jgi:hypothetical protein
LGFGLRFKVELLVFVVAMIGYGDGSVWAFGLVCFLLVFIGLAAGDDTSGTGWLVRLVDGATDLHG